jgi:hypothetical protein
MRNQPPRSGLHPGWAGLVLAAVAWHGISICCRHGCDYLLSLCFLANIVLAAGILARSGLLLGIGYGWALIALPLWAFHSFHAGGVAPSSIALHGTGVGVGFLASRRTPIPGRLALAAVPFGLFSMLLARLCTRPEFNINTAFRVQDGWTQIFQNYPVYLAVQVVAYTTVFSILPRIGNRGVHARIEGS